MSDTAVAMAELPPLPILPALCAEYLTPELKPSGPLQSLDKDITKRRNRRQHSSPLRQSWKMVTRKEDGERRLGYHYYCDERIKGLG